MKKLFYTLALIFFNTVAFADDLTFAVTNTTTGFSIGAVDMNVSGGVAPFTYSWNGPAGFSANTEDISGLATGTYTITVTDHYCGVATTTVFVDALTGVTEASNGFDFSIFPNPAKDQISLTSENTLKNADIKVIDLNGKRVSETTNVSGNSFTINVSGQPKGIYFIEINNEGSVSRKRFMKQ